MMNNGASRILCVIFVLFLLLNCEVESRKGSSSSASTNLSRSSSSSSSSSSSRGSSSSRSSAASSSSSSSSSSNANGRGTSSSGSSNSNSRPPVVVSSGSNSNINRLPVPVAVSGGSSSTGGNSISTKGSSGGSLLGSSKFKAAIVGAAAGYVAYKGGKAIIKSASRPMFWGGRNYYWSSNYYQQQTGYMMCSASIENDAYFANFAFEDGNRPRQVVWSCRSVSEICCGYECCGAADNAVIIILGGSTNSTTNASEWALSNSSSGSLETTDTVFTDCYDIKQQNPVAADGVYAIQPLNASIPFEVYCDMNTDNGGWTVFQRRSDGSQDFTSQNWTNYEDGFGNVTHEYWLGLKKLYWLTEKDVGSPVQMRVDITDCTGHALFEIYENFTIGDASTKYALLNASGANGTIGDAFSAYLSQIGSAFSTEDNGSAAGSSCASVLKGGWWYSNCGSSHLNSVYYPGCNYNGSKHDGITWEVGIMQNNSRYSSIMNTKMMIRRSHF